MDENQTSSWTSSTSTSAEDFVAHNPLHCKLLDREGMKQGAEAVFSCSAPGAPPARSHADRRGRPRRQPPRGAARQGGCWSPRDEQGSRNEERRRVVRVRDGKIVNTSQRTCRACLAAAWRTAGPPSPGVAHLSGLRHQPTDATPWPQSSRIMAARTPDKVEAPAGRRWLPHSQSWKIALSTCALACGARPCAGGTLTQHCEGRARRHEMRVASTACAPTVQRHVCSMGRLLPVC